MSEELHKHYAKDFNMQTRIARFHNIYGPQGTWKGGREKAPAAFCRKVNSVDGCAMFVCSGLTIRPSGKGRPSIAATAIKRFCCL